MKKEMLPGEYTQLNYKTYRCVAVTDLSQQKRCLLCALREFGILRLDPRNERLRVAKPPLRLNPRSEELLGPRLASPLDLLIYVPVGKTKKFNNPKIN